MASIYEQFLETSRFFEVLPKPGSPEAAAMGFDRCTETFEDWDVKCALLLDLHHRAFQKLLGDMGTSMLGASGWERLQKCADMDAYCAAMEPVFARVYDIWSAEYTVQDRLRLMASVLRDDCLDDSDVELLEELLQEDIF